MPRPLPLAVLVAGGVVIGIGALAVTRGDGDGTVSPDGPVAVAEQRDLRTTESITGTLARADTTTVLHGGIGGGAAAGGGGVQPVALTGTTTTATPTTSTSTSTSTSTTSTTGSTTSTTAPPATSPPTTSAPATTTPLQGGGGVGGGGGAVVDSAPRSGGGGAGPTGVQGVGDGLGAASGATDAGATQDTSATVTEIVAIGEEVGQGSTLYRADDEPVVSLVAPDPLFRDLDTEADDGADVLALEQGLAALGHGEGLTVDSTYDSSTAAAVEAWETDLGRAAPDGVVTVGEVVLLAEPATVLGQDAVVGDTVQTGTPVLTLGTESQVVDVAVDATETGEWAVGTPVEVAWSDGSVGTGSVVDLGRDEADGTVPAVVALAQQDSGRPVGTEVDVVRTTAERPGTLAVPVAAVVFGDDGPAVRLVEGDAAATDDVATGVTLGIVSGGWVEITDGLAEGDQVRLPG